MAPTGPPPWWGREGSLQQEEAGGTQRRGHHPVRTSTPGAYSLREGRERHGGLVSPLRAPLHAWTPLCSGEGDAASPSWHPPLAGGLAGGASPSCDSACWVLASSDTSLIGDCGSQEVGRGVMLPESCPPRGEGRGEGEGGQRLGWTQRAKRCRAGMLGDPLSHILGSHGQRDGNIKRISQPPGGVSERQAGRCWSCTE